MNVYKEYVAVFVMSGFVLFLFTNDHFAPYLTLQDKRDSSKPNKETNE